MGTRGYYVIRYRNMYFTSRHYSYGFPESLGLKVLQSIRQPNGIATYRQVFGEMLDGLTSPSHSLLLIENGDDFEPPSEQRPQRPIWIYEIDLDHNIFHINGIPFFTLECLPDDEAFVQYASEDRYGHTACTSRCPPEHKYKKPAPPTIDISGLATYRSLICTGSQVALSDLLNISDILSQREHVRVSLLEVMIGQCMFSSVICKEIHEIEFANDHNQFTNDQWSIACFMASIVFVPQMFDHIRRVCHPEPKRKEFTWVRGDTVVCIATHLDNEQCLQASVSRLINAILEQKDNPGYYFGIAFSVNHCAIIKVVKDTHTITFSHTNALQFLPSFYARSPSTPGITALARLGYRIDPALFERVMEICNYKLRMPVRIQTEQSLAQGAADDDDHDVSPNTICPPLPLELWQEIARYLPHFDLITLGLVSNLCREAALMLLRYPYLCGYRLVSPPKKIPKYLRGKKRLSMRAASFSAVRAGFRSTVYIGVESEDIPSKSMITPLRVKKFRLYVEFSRKRRYG
ncbi:hypothetical protein DEU56DRAFT_850787 [Suillus clintonianus]|uniref:uncharacterized protein n=1 Tax=Suillus clintonianus TaxID=1904413 RepID=UPI001B869A01|nr:uncharacterized protein DEU56DRAFT_850787 [Suillus clintonianus]KAG2150971.1 hypothetical protein DEU56DRAFT_850787 [Suillus clintonianus]